MKPIIELSKKDIKNLKLIVLDLDGVLVPRGTKIKERANILKLGIKTVPPSIIKKIRLLSKMGFEINVNSGRGLWMLQHMLHDILDFISLTYENGSATWYKGKIYQHANSFSKLHHLYEKLRFVKHKDILGFEPKEFIITIHCKKRVKEIEKIISKHKEVYYIWNNEAYDIGIKNLQIKSRGLKSLREILKLKKENVMAIGDNYNDIDMLKESGMPISADPSRVKGDFYVELNKKTLPAEQLIDRILEVKK